MVAVSTDDPARARTLLNHVRRLQPRHVVQLAGLWAGVVDGVADRQRQRRRDAARRALRVANRRDAETSRAEERRCVAAAEAVAAAILSSGEAGGTSLRTAASDAVQAVIDALDAIAWQERLTEAAYGELMRPWRGLQAQIRSERARP